MFEKNQVYEEKDYIKIITKRFYPRPGFLLVITISWSLMTYIFITGGFDEHKPPIILYVFFICISTALAWYLSVIIFNKTHIIINKSHLYISRKPIPWFGNKQIDISEIKDFYTEECENNPNDYYHGKGDTSYVVWGSRKDEKKFTITRLKKKEQAESLKQKIEECVYKQKKKVRV